MPIPFTLIPSPYRVPGTYVELDSSGANTGPALKKFENLLVGHKITAGTQAVDTPVTIASAAQAKTLFGDGSMLHNMAEAWFASNQSAKLTAIAVAEPGAGVAATATITISGTSTAAGTLSVYIGGRLVTTAITNSMASTAVATALAAAITATTGLPVTASAAASTVTLTQRHKGVFGNALDVRLNYYSSESTPAGLTVTPSAFTGGSGAPTFTTAFAAITGTQYDIIVWPFNDTASIALLKTELDARAGPLQQIQGLAIMSLTGSAATVATFGFGQNSEFMCCFATQASPTPTYEIAADAAALIAQSAENDPARPLQTLALVTTKAPAPAARFTATERNNCLFDGISTFTVGAGDVVRIERPITFYQVSPAGAQTIAYLDIETVLTLSYFRYDLRNSILEQFPRHKLANDGTKFGAGQPVMTPQVMRGFLSSKHVQWETLGLAENFDFFKANMIVERNLIDANRLDIQVTPDLVNQLMITAIQMKFKV